MASKKSYKKPKQSDGTLFVDSLPNVKMKTCRICCIEKPTSDFPYHSQHKDGFDSRCKKCIKEKSKELKEIKEKYNKKRKSDKCECCGIITKNLCTDHDHVTKKHRGFICQSCNLSIGRLGDNLEGVMKAVYYLRKAEKNALKEKNNENPNDIY